MHYIDYVDLMMELISTIIIASCYIMISYNPPLESYNSSIPAKEASVGNNLGPLLKNEDFILIVLVVRAVSFFLAVLPCICCSCKPQEKNDETVVDDETDDYYKRIEEEET